MSLHTTIDQDMRNAIRKYEDINQNGGENIYCSHEDADDRMGMGMDNTPLSMLLRTKLMKMFVTSCAGGLHLGTSTLPTVRLYPVDVFGTQDLVIYTGKVSLVHRWQS